MTIPLCDDQKFEKYISSKLNGLQHMHDTPITLTGNPFVDAGLITIAIQANVDVTKLTLGDLISNYRKGTFKDGRDLSTRNYTYKGTSMIFSTNTPLLQPGFTKKKGKSKDPCYTAIEDGLYSPIAEHIFRTYLTHFLTSIPSKGQSHCAICNASTSLNFYEIDQEMNASLPTPKSSNFSNGLSRLWFPLMGTIGSEAQSYPGFTEQPIVCGKCLFAVQYLPQATRLFRGKLVLYQTSDLYLWTELIRDNLNEFESVYALGTQKKMELVGKKDHQGTYLIKLIDVISRNWESLKSHNLLLWLFVSSGQNVDIDVIQLPDNILTFLYELTKDPETEDALKSLLNNEKKVYSDNSFLSRMLAGRDYPYLYASTKQKSIPRKFYELYQISITEVDASILDFTRSIAEQIYSIKSESAIISMLKAGNTTRNAELKQLLYPQILQYARTQNLDVVHTWLLSENKWRYFDYFLHPNVDRKNPTTYESSLQAFTYSQLLQQLDNYARYYLKSEQVRSTYDATKVLSINNVTRLLDSIFLQLSHNYAGFTWETHEILKADLQEIYKGNRSLTLVFQLLLIKLQAIDDLSIIDNQISNIRILESESKIAMPLLLDIYEYILQRKLSMKSFRGIRDLSGLIQYGKYSFNGFLLFLRQKGIATQEESWYKTYSDGAQYSGIKWGGGSSIYSVSATSADNFSWARVKSQLLAFLNQLQFLPNWEEQLQTRLDELFPEVEL